MPSVSTRLAFQRMVIAGAEAAAAAANAAAANANAAIDDLEAGNLDLDAVTVGGERFVNTGGSLNPEP